MGAKRVNDLAEVLQWLTERRAGVSPAAATEEVDSLKLMVQHLATSVALHEVQIHKLREVLAAEVLRRES